MNRRVTIALSQFPSSPGDEEGNLARALQVVRESADAGADFLCFPETFLSGFNMDQLTRGLMDRAHRLEGTAVSALREAAARHGLFLVAPLFIREEGDGGVTNTAVFIDDRGEIRGTYTKNHLWPLEAEHLVGGMGDYPVFDTPHGRVGILICYDANFPEPSRILALKGAELVFIPCAWRIQDRHFYDIAMQARAMDNQFFVAATNIVGQQAQDLYLFGNAEVVNPRGVVVAQSGLDGPDLLVADVDLDEVARSRTMPPLLADRKPEHYSLIVAPRDE